MVTFDYVLYFVDLNLRWIPILAVLLCLAALKLLAQDVVFIWLRAKSALVSSPHIGVIRVERLHI